MMQSYFLLLIFFKSATAEICNLKNNSNNIDKQCLNQLTTICKHPNLLLKMYDASSKYPPTGLLYSTNRDYGNHPECLSIVYEDSNGRILGKHCGLALAVPNLLRNLSDITLLSVCVPDACSPREIVKFLFPNRVLPFIVYTNTTCETIESNTDLNRGDLAFIFLLTMILILIIMSTTYDIYLRIIKKKCNPIHLSFSFLTNGQKLVHINEKNPEQIQCLNGLRFISMLWVIAGHGFVSWEMLSVINKPEGLKWQNDLQSQYITSAPISVDTFFFLSGLLLSYGYLKMATNLSVKNMIFGIPSMFLHRYLRLTPAAGALFFVTITIFKSLGSGPLWPMVVDRMSDPCRKNWLEYFFYVQNYVNYKNICLNHTWYLSADMQMFILSPIVLIPMALLIKKHFYTLLIGLLGLVVVCTAALPMAIRFATHFTDNVYDTHSRLVDYLIGIIFGAILRQKKGKHFLFNKQTNAIIWILVLSSCLAFNIYYHYVLVDYEFTKDTLFYGLYRPLWCISLGWIVYSCHYGYGGFINTILSVPIFQIGGRLSYCMYLLHALIESYWVGTMRTDSYFSDYTVFYAWCGHFMVTTILSTLWTLTFESPIIILEKFLFGQIEKPTKKTADS